MKGIGFFVLLFIIIFFSACAETPRVYQKSSGQKVVSQKSISYEESNITPQELAAVFENTPKVQQIPQKPAQKSIAPTKNTKVITESTTESTESLTESTQKSPKESAPKKQPKNPNPIPPEILIESAKSMSQMTQNITPMLEIKPQDDFHTAPKAQNPPQTQNPPDLAQSQLDSTDSNPNEENPKKNEGIFQVFNKRGLLIYEAHYKNDKLHGIAKIFDVESGALKSEMNFAYGAQEGEMRIYDTKGHLWHKLQYQKGKKHGLAQEFNDKGAVVGEVRYEDNKEVKAN